MIKKIKGRVNIYNLRLLHLTHLKNIQVAASSLKVKKRRDMIQQRIRNQFVNYPLRTIKKDTEEVIRAL